MIRLFANTVSVGNEKYTKNNNINYIVDITIKQYLALTNLDLQSVTTK